MNSAVMTFISLSVSGSILALIILLLKPLLKNRAGKAFSYYIWLLVLLRLVLPFSPSANLINTLLVTSTAPPAAASASESAAVPISDTNAVSVNESAIPEENAALTPASSGTPSVSAGSQLDVWALLKQNLLWVWLAGVCIYLLCFIIPYLRFIHSIGKASVPLPKEDRVIFDAMSQGKRVKLLHCPHIRTPMLIGVVHPRIIVPRPSYTQNGREEELSYILTHELAHHRRYDLIYKWITVCISALHWFNPMMFLIQREISRACELSCDEAVISGMSEPERRQYGQTLLALAADGRLPAGIPATTMCEDKRQLKERLTGIKKYRGSSAGTVAASAVLAVLLAGCGAGLGSATSPKASVVSSPQTNASPSITAASPSPITEIEFIAGGVPIDIADNETSRAYLPYLVKEAKRIQPDLEGSSSPYPFKLFAAVPFQGGALMLAGTAISEDYPMLYYMVGEKVVAINYGAEYFSSNYTVFQGVTIAYGRMVGVYTKNPYVYATGVKATFAGGQEVKAQSFVPDTLPDTQGGYILVADGETWLTGLEFYRPDGTLLTDMTHTDEYGWDQDSWLYRGTAAEIFNLQHLTQFSTWDEQPIAYTVITDGGISAPLNAFFDDGMDISYLWRNNNILHHMRGSAPSVPLTVASYPDIITELDYPERTDGVPLPNSAEVYWFDLSNEDGTQKDFDALLKPGKLVTPDEDGLYLLVIRDNGWWYDQVIYVE